ncbi:MAG: hypothetical protein Q9217_003616 [Psora testacea]
MSRRLILAIYGITHLVLHALAFHHAHHHDNKRSQSMTDPLVFAHYMIVVPPPNGDYTHDITLAKAAGIDAFAVNYGGWDCDWTLLAGFLETFYRNASALNFKLFMSYDTTIMNDPAMMVNISNTYVHHPAQLWVDNKIFLSSFTPDPPPWSWQTDVLDKIDGPVMFMPGTLSQSAASVAVEDVGSGPFTWIHPCNSTEEEATIDADFSNQRKVAAKPWMAGVAPWFFKRLGEDMNWLHAQDSGMWLDRWMHLLELKPNFIEVVTWNDFGESSYIGPAPSNQQAHGDCYYGALDHTAFLKMSKIFIKAFKANQTRITVAPEDEDVFFFYRRQPAEANGRLDYLALPKNVADIKDNVYVVAFLASEAVITLTSGDEHIPLSFPPGVGKRAVPWKLGNQSLSMNRKLGNGKTLSKKGPAVVGQMDRYQGNVVAL